MNLQNKFNHICLLKGDEMKVALANLTADESKYINARMIVLSLEGKIAEWKGFISAMESKQHLAKS